VFLIPGNGFGQSQLNEADRVTQARTSSTRNVRLAGASGSKRIDLFMSLPCCWRRAAEKSQEVSGQLWHDTTRKFCERVLCIPGNGCGQSKLIEADRVTQASTSSTHNVRLARASGSKRIDLFMSLPCLLAQVTRGAFLSPRDTKEHGEE